MSEIKITSQLQMFDLQLALLADRVVDLAAQLAKQAGEEAPRPMPRRWLELAAETMIAESRLLFDILDIQLWQPSSPRQQQPQTQPDRGDATGP